MVKLIRSILHASVVISLVFVLHTSQATNVTDFMYNHVMHPAVYRRMKENPPKIPQTIDQYVLESQLAYAPSGRMPNVMEKPEHTYIVGKKYDVKKSIRNGHKVYRNKRGEGPTNIIECKDKFPLLHVCRNADGKVIKVSDLGHRRFAVGVRGKFQPVHYQPKYVGGDESPTHAPQVIYPNKK